MTNPKKTVSKGEECTKNSAYACGRLVSTVPFALAVSGVPSPFVLFSSLLMSVECLVSALLSPSCFPDWEFAPPAGLEAAG
jgi:hypothetical protein